MRRALVALLILVVAVTVLAFTDHLPRRHTGRGTDSVDNELLSGHHGNPGVASWAPWPHALHYAQHTGNASAAGPVGGHLRWTCGLEGNVTAGPLVGADGTIYAASNAGVLHALDPATGKDRWTYYGDGSYGIDQSTSPAVLPDVNVLWPGPHNTLYELSLRGVRLGRWRSAAT